MLTRKLDLKREALTALTTGEMAAFAGAGGGTTGPQPTPPQHLPPTLDLAVCLDTLVTC